MAAVLSGGEKAVAGGSKARGRWWRRWRREAGGDGG